MYPKTAEKPVLDYWANYIFSYNLETTKRRLVIFFSRLWKKKATKFDQIFEVNEWILFHEISTLIKYWIFPTLFSKPLFSYQWRNRMRMEIIHLQVLMTMSTFLMIKIKDKKERTGFLVEIAKSLLREKSQDKEEKEKVILFK